MNWANVKLLRCPIMGSAIDDSFDDGRGRRIFDSHVCGEHLDGRSHFSYGLNAEFVCDHGMIAPIAPTAPFPDHVKHIVLVRPEEQMIRAYAAPVVTPMQDVQFVGNRAISEYPCNTVRWGVLPEISKASIAQLMHEPRGPFPAPILGLTGDLFPEPILKGLTRHLASDIAVPMDEAPDVPVMVDGLKRGSAPAPAVHYRLDAGSAVVPADVFVMSLDRLPASAYTDNRHTIPLRVSSL